MCSECASREAATKSLRRWQWGRGGKNHSQTNCFLADSPSLHSVSCSPERGGSRQPHRHVSSLGQPWNTRCCYKINTQHLSRNKWASWQDTQQRFDFLSHSGWTLPRLSPCSCVLTSGSLWENRQLTRLWKNGKASCLLSLLLASWRSKVPS